MLVMLPNAENCINLTPADLRKEGPSFDLPISVGNNGSPEQVSGQLLEITCFRRSFLDGSLRAVAGVTHCSCRS